MPQSVEHIAFVVTKYLVTHSVPRPIEGMLIKVLANIVVKGLYGLHNLSIEWHESFTSILC